MNEKNNEILKIEMERINREFVQSLGEYRKKISYMVGDTPIETLCLPKSTQTILLNQGIIRVYDLFNLDLVKIKGLGETRIRNLTARLDEFFSVCG